MTKNLILIGFLTVLTIAALMMPGCDLSAPSQSISNFPQSTTSGNQSSEATPLPSITTDDLPLVYQDDFSDPEKWNISSSADVSKFFNNGEYCLSINKPGTIYGSGSNALGVQSNFVVCLDARIQSASNDTAYGIEFKWNENSGFYYFNIKNNLYSVQKCNYGKWEYLQNYTKSNYIKTDGSANQLKIACLGKTIEVYINGQRLTTVRDDSLTFGEIRLAAEGTNSEILFDNLKLYHFANTYIMNADPSLPVITTSKLIAGEVGVKYNQTLSVSGGASQCTWSIIDGNLPEGLSLSTSTGQITGIPDMEGKYDFTLQVTGSAGKTTLPMSITVTSLIISTAHLPDGTLDTEYNYALEASGGTSPYTWALDSGYLPDGLKLNTSTGAITGIPTEAGGPVSPFFKVRDSAGAVKIKGLSITIKLGDFQEIDKWAINVPSSSETSIKTLVAYLIKPCHNDMEKARVIYRWIDENISYDVKTGERIEAGIYSNNPDQSAEAVFSRRNGVCEGYSRLFKQMANYAGLQAEYISGWGKVDYSYLKAKYYKKDHAWNAVQIIGEWRLVDLTWGAGWVDDNGTFVREFDDFWFLTPPEQFVYTHYPADSNWQLLKMPYSASAISQHPLVKPAFFKYGLQLGQNDYPYYTVKNELFITVPTPPDVILSATVSKNDENLKGNYTFCQRKDDTNYEVHALFPGIGDYELKIFAKWQNEPGDYHTALIYQVEASQNPGVMTEFPIEYTTFCEKGAYLYSWISGNIQAGTAYNFKVSIPVALSVAVITYTDSGSPVFQYLTKNGQVFEGKLNVVKGKINISAKFPGDDTYWALLEYYGR